MTVEVKSNLTTRCRAEVLASFIEHSISGSMGTESLVDATDEEAVPVEGTYCFGWDIDIETGGWVATLASTNLTGQHAYVWAFFAIPDQLEVQNPGAGQGGVFIIGRDTSGNHGYWHVGGKDTYLGGWKCFVADLGQSPDTNDGSAPSMAACNGLGIGFRNYGKSKAARNAYVDFIRTGNDGIRVTTSNASVADWDDIYREDADQAIGVISKYGGVYYVQGPIDFGKTSASACEFSDTSKIIIFEDALVSSTLYRIRVLGNTSASTNFQLGAKSGSAGIEGCTVYAPDGKPVRLEASDANINQFKLYGSTFIGATQCWLPSHSANYGREVISCNFNTGGQVHASTCKIRKTFFVSPKYSAVEINSANHNVASCDIINASMGVELTNATDIDLSGVMFSGCTYGIWNTSGGNASVFAIGDSNPGTASDPGTSDTDIITAVYLNVYAKTVAGVGIHDARVRVETSVATPLLNASTNAAGLAQTTYNYLTDKAVTIRARKSSGTPKYYPIKTSGTIYSTGLNVTVTMTQDNIAST